MAASLVLGIWSPLGSFAGFTVAFQGRRHPDPGFTCAPICTRTLPWHCKVQLCPREPCCPQQSRCRHQCKSNEETAYWVAWPIESHWCLSEQTTGNTSKFRLGWITVWGLVKRGSQTCSSPFSKYFGLCFWMRQKKRNSSRNFGFSTALCFRWGCRGSLVVGPS